MTNGMQGVVVIGADAETLAAELCQRTSRPVHWVRHSDAVRDPSVAAVVVAGRSAYIDLIGIRANPAMRTVPVVLCAEPLLALQEKWYWRDVVQITERDDVASRCTIAIEELCADDPATAA